MMHNPSVSIALDFLNVFSSILDKVTSISDIFSASWIGKAMVENSELIDTVPSFDEEEDGRTISQETCDMTLVWPTRTIAVPSEGPVVILIFLKSFIPLASTLVPSLIAFCIKLWWLTEKFILVKKDFLTKTRYLGIYSFFTSLYISANTRVNRSHSSPSFDSFFKARDRNFDEM